MPEAGANLKMRSQVSSRAGNVDQGQVLQARDSRSHVQHGRQHIKQSQVPETQGQAQNICQVLQGPLRQLTLVEGQLQSLCLQCRIWRSAHGSAS